MIDDGQLYVGGGFEIATQSARRFVGREAPLAALRAELDRAIAGSGRLVLLAGEPGIGKTRLAEALAEHAQERAVAVLWGRCWEAGGAPPYWPWTQILRAYVRRSGAAHCAAQLGTAAAHVAQIIPELRAHLHGPATPSSSLDRKHARFALFDAVTTFLVGASAARPLLLVLDNLHAADASTLLLLRFLAERRRITSGAAAVRPTIPSNAPARRWPGASAIPWQRSSASTRSSAAISASRSGPAPSAPTLPPSRLHGSCARSGDSSVPSRKLVA